MSRIRLPNNWSPRQYQLPAWEYLEGGGKHAELIWHRRSGKDDLCLHWAAVAAIQRPATYWHMLPEASQARKAIWEAVNPHSGKRRIDEAFPHEIRSSTREQEMLIRFVNGSTWQVVGSDNYDSLVGSPPAGVVFSEWALAKPEARAMLRPILAENGGWQIYITTPRGPNHAKNSYDAAKSDPDCFAQTLMATETGVFTPERLEKERLAYIADYGNDLGQALFEQEYLCSFSGDAHGGVIKRQWWRMWPKDRPLPECLHIVASYDTAYTERDHKDSAYSARTTWGIFRDETMDRHCMLLLDGWHERIDYPGLRKLARKHFRSANVDRALIEKKASGQSLIQDLRRAKIPTYGYDPGKLDKVARANLATPLFEAGQIYYPDRDWARRIIDYVAQFPNGAPPSADYTDTVTQAALYLRRGWWIRPPDEDDAPVDKKQMHEDEDDDTGRNNRKGGAYG